MPLALMRCGAYTTLKEIAKFKFGVDLEYSVAIEESRMIAARFANFRQHVAPPHVLSDTNVNTQTHRRLFVTRTHKVGQILPPSDLCYPACKLQK
jgi:hypothetical protein